MGKRFYEVIKDGTGKATAARPALPGADLLFTTTPTGGGGGTDPPPGGGGGGGLPPGGGTYTPPTVPNMTLVLDDQFPKIDMTKWKVYDSTLFSTAAKQRQAYMAANAVAGVGTTGATNGTSLKLTTKRQAVTIPDGAFDFTAGLLDSKSVGVYHPRYGRFEFRCKIPHGQGLWPSIWLTAKNGGFNTAEIDMMEVFHAQVPGSNHTTMHGSDNTGHFNPNWYQNNGGSTGWPFRTFFEHPTYTPAWHTWACEIIPVTDATGATKAADVTAPSNYVRVSMFLDGVKVFEFVNTSSTFWTTNGGSNDSFWNVYLQGCQVGGNYVGEIDGPLGYSTALNQCLISGTPPNTCSITRNGTDKVQRAQFDGVANVLEIDFFRVYKLTS